MVCIVDGCAGQNAADTDYSQIITFPSNKIKFLVSAVQPSVVAILTRPLIIISQYSGSLVSIPCLIHITFCTLLASHLEQLCIFHCFY
jgi:hypothetical protein